MATCRELTEEDVETDVSEFIVPQINPLATPNRKVRTSSGSSTESDTPAGIQSDTEYKSGSDSSEEQTDAYANEGNNSLQPPLHQSRATARQSPDSQHLLVSGKRQSFPKVDGRYPQISGERDPTPKERHPKYKAIEARARSFEKRKWAYSTGKLTGDYMAQSGFVYKGSVTKDGVTYTDCVICYKCGQSLCNFKANDDPVQDHDRLYPFCKTTFGTEHFSQIHV